MFDAYSFALRDLDAVAAQVVLGGRLGDRILWMLVPAWIAVVAGQFPFRAVAKAVVRMGATDLIVTVLRVVPAMLMQGAFERIRLVIE